MAGTPASSRGGGAGAGVASVAATDGSVVVAGTAADPTIATGALNAIATAHPPVASVALNAQKITGLANGAAASDAAAFGQLVALPVGIASGGTGQVTKAPAFDALSPLTTKGDLLSFSTLGVRVAAGTDFADVLIPDAAQTAGIKWSRRRHALRPTGSLFENFQRLGFTTVATLGPNTNGVLRLFAIDLPSGLLVTSLSFLSGTTALTIGVHQWFALFDSARAKLQVTANDTNAAWAANTVKTLTLAATFTTTYSGLHYVGICITATTVPTMAGYSSTTTVLGLAPILAGTSDAGLTDPASCPATAAALTTVSGCYYCFVN